MRCCSPLICLILVSSVLLLIPCICFSILLIQLYKILTQSGKNNSSEKTSRLLESSKLPSHLFWGCCQLQKFHDWVPVSYYQYYNSSLNFTNNVTFDLMLMLCLNFHNFLRYIFLASNTSGLYTSIFQKKQLYIWTRNQNI